MPEYKEEAIRRARRKLDEMRAGNVVHFRAGPFWGRIVSGAFLVLVGLFMPAAVYALVPDQGPQRGEAMQGVLIVAAASMGIVVPGLLMMRFSKATTPRRALKLFYKSIARGKMRAARRLVVPNDFDGFPRRYPNHPALGRGGSPPYAFNAPLGFEGYWEGLVRYPNSPYCFVAVRDLRVEEVAPDLAIAEFRLKLTINTSLWILLIFLGLLIALIIDLLTRKRVNEPIRKILVRVDDEWHLFSGEFEGPDEADTSWLGGEGARGGAGGYLMRRSAKG